MRTFPRFNADHVVAGVIVVTVIVLLSLFVNGNWVFPVLGR